MFLKIQECRVENGGHFTMQGRRRETFTYREGWRRDELGKAGGRRARGRVPELDLEGGRCGSPPSRATLASAALAATLRRDAVRHPALHLAGHHLALALTTISSSSSRRN